MNLVFRLPRAGNPVFSLRTNNRSKKIMQGEKLQIGKAESRRQRSSILLLTPQMTATAGAGLVTHRGGRGRSKHVSHLPLPSEAP